MKRTALLIPCLTVLFGCQREEVKPVETPVPPAAMAPAAPSAPASAPAVPQAASGATGQAEKKPAPVAAEAKPVPAEATQAAVPAAPAPAPKAEVAMAPVETSSLPAVSEAEALALAKKKNCLACHQVDKKVLGPSWKDVANKYRGDATAQARLENVIAKGGAKVWGNQPMPPQPQVSEADRRLLVRFILGLK
jgi:cytochrome c